MKYQNGSDYEELLPNFDNSKVSIQTSQISGGVLPVERGGTGQTSTAGLKTALGISDGTSHTGIVCAKSTNIIISAGKNETKNYDLITSAYPVDFFMIQYTRIKSSLVQPAKDYVPDLVVFYFFSSTTPVKIAYISHATSGSSGSTISLQIINNKTLRLIEYAYGTYSGNYEWTINILGYKNP